MEHRYTNNLRVSSPPIRNILIVYYCIKFRTECPEKNGKTGGFPEGLAKEFAFLRLWFLYGYIAFDRRDNHKNYGIFVQTKQVVEVPLLGLELRFYRLRFITLQAIPVS